ncbi:sensor histidine kinase [Qipengyuania sp. DSG2-2]|uniref:sensor histidine kinase n=1 Tax=Qipengyuania sp. DGS2-2 TaxID=3349631 RepID=UPI0036D21388
MFSQAALAPDTTDRLSPRLVLASIVGLWLFYFVMVTLRGSILGLELQAEMMWRRSLVSVAGVAVTCVLWMVLRLVDNRTLGWKVAVAMIAALPASILIAQINQWVFADLEGKLVEKVGEREGIKLRKDEAGNVLIDIPGVSGQVDETSPDGEQRVETVTVTLQSAPTGFDKWRQISDIALGRYFLLIAWASLYLALLAGAQARAAERREGEFRRAAKAAELRSLRYQVNPHFLFNTLNSLSSLVMTGRTERAEDMIQAMSNFYRHSLADDTTADVPLADEFALQRHYLDIEEARFPDRLATRFDLPAGLEECRVPGMILQPLVENSVKYAVAPAKRTATIEISARAEGGTIILRVADDGSGQGVDIGVTPGFGIGLANVRDRLKARFGDRVTVRSGPEGDGYATEITLPKDCR